MTVKRAMSSGVLGAPHNWNHMPAEVTCMYAQLCKDTFQGKKHLSLAWDSSFHSEDCVVFLSWTWHFTCHVSRQPTLGSQKWTVSFNSWARSTNWSGSAFQQLKAVDHALNSLGLNLCDFKIPGDVLVRPVGAGGVRVISEGRACFVDTVQECVTPQAPPEISWSSLPCLSTQ